MQDMPDRVLADPTATNTMECEEYVATAVDGDGMFEHQSEHKACKDEFRQNIRSHSWSVFYVL